MTFAHPPAARPPGAQSPGEDAEQQGGMPIGRWCAAAVLVCGGRYLMQLRDDKPDILLPGHWALFGGAIDPGETPEQAMLRELEEELEFRPRAVELLTEMSVILPMKTPRRDRMSFFLAQATADEHAAMVQHEGAGMGLFTAADLTQMPRISPWDLAVILMHARRTALFPD